MPCKTKSECYYGRENACQEYDCCPREDGYNLADDFDDMISQPKRTKEPRLQTWHNGSVTVETLNQEHLETPNDVLFKFNPSMRING